MTVSKEIQGQFFLQLTYWCMDGACGKKPLGSLERNHPGGSLKSPQVMNEARGKDSVCGTEDKIKD